MHFQAWLVSFKSFCNFCVMLKKLIFILIFFNITSLESQSKLFSDDVFNSTKNIETIKRSSILELLNSLLLKEYNLQLKNIYEDYEKFKIIKKFSTIHSDSIKCSNDSSDIIKPGMILVLELQKESLIDSYYIEKQEVPLCKITKIVKDGQLLFETDSNAVKVTTIKDGQTQYFTRSTFYLAIVREKKNEYLSKKIIKAFYKEGFIIEKGFWAD